MFSRDDQTLDRLFTKYTFFKVMGNGHSIHFMFVESMDQARNVVSKARTFDREADVMVIYDYTINS